MSDWDPEDPDDLYEATRKVLQFTKFKAYMEYLQTIEGYPDEIKTNRDTYKQMTINVALFMQRVLKRARGKARGEGRNVISQQDMQFAINWELHRMM